MESEHDRKWEREIQPLDFSPSSGSVGNNKYPHGPTEHDGSAQTDTTFRPYEAAPDTRNWNHMDQIQDGKYAGGERDKRRRHADQRRDLDIFAEECNLTSWEKSYAEHLLNKLHQHEIDRREDEEKDGSFYIRSESLVLAVITYSANKNERRIRQTDEFNELRNNCNVSRKKIRSERQSIREVM